MTKIPDSEHDAGKKVRTTAEETAERKAEAAAETTAETAAETAAEAAAERKDKTELKAKSKTERRHLTWGSRPVAIILAAILLLEIVGGLLFFGYVHHRENTGFQAVVSRNPAAVAKLGRIWSLLQNNYYLPLKDEQLFEAVYAGLPSNLGSKFTRYMTKQENEDFRQSISGEYCGIGATVSQAPNKELSIADLVPDSPAAKAGLQIGDIFVRVNGKSVQEFADVTALALTVRGKEGTTVELEMRRPSQAKNITFKVVRGKVKTVEVMAKILPTADTFNTKMGYIRVREFTETMAEQFIPALKKVVQEGAEKIVLDLRNNPGGDAEAMSKALDAIMEEGPIATIRGRYHGRAYQTEWKTNKGAMIPSTVKFAILLNGNSASASEFFSGALRDRGRAKLIGTQTYGKGVATQTHVLPDGSALNITTFQYILPKGESLDGVGLRPDIEVTLAPEAQRKNVETLTLAEDSQLARAIKYLHEGK